MPITNANPIVAYVGNGVSNSFPFLFKIFAIADMKVTIDGVLMAYGTDYALTGVGSDAGGSVVFVVPPLNLAAVLLYRQVSYDRVATDYQEGGDFLADAIDNDLDREEAQIQQVVRDMVRCLKLPIDVTTEETIIGSAAARIGKLVGFDSFGNAVLFDPSGIGIAATTPYSLTLLAASTALAARRVLGVEGRVFWCGTAGGTPNALTLTPADPTLAYAAGDVYLFKTASLNTAASTVAISGLGATAIQNGGAALVGGELEAGKWYMLMYDGAAFQHIPIHRKPVGTAGQSLIVDTAQPDKLRYGNVSKWYIEGLTVGNAAVNSLTVSAGSCMDINGTELIELAAPITKTTAGAWVVGNNQPGMAGVEVVANNTWYHVFVAKRVDTGVVDVVISQGAVSLVPPPASYTKWRHIGFARTNGAAQFDNFTTVEIGGGAVRINFATLTTDINLANTLTTAKRLDNVRAPPNIITKARIRGRMADATVAGQGTIYDPLTEADVAPSAGGAPMCNFNWLTTAADFRELDIWTQNGQVAARATVATVDTYIATTVSLEWPRRGLN